MRRITWSARLAFIGVFLRNNAADRHHAPHTHHGKRADHWAKIIKRVSENNQLTEKPRMSWFSSAPEANHSDDVAAPEIVLDSESESSADVGLLDMDLDGYNSESDPWWEPTSEDERDAEIDEEYEAVMDDLDDGCIDDEELVHLYKDAGILSADVTVDATDDDAEAEMIRDVVQTMRIGAVIENTCGTCGNQLHMVVADDEYVYLRCEACAEEKTICSVEMYKFALGAAHKTVRAIYA